MRFRGLDLNLLVVLDAVLSERNVTRAAERIGLSQSATSSALNRLREYFKDELVFHNGRTFKLTGRALQLQPFLKQFLASIDRNILAGPSFDPAEAKRSIKIMVSDFVVVSALAKGLAAVNRMAPGLAFELSPLGAEPHRHLERCDVDILIAPETFISRLHPYAEYFKDDYVCIADSDNPVCHRTLTVDEYLAQPHAVVRHQGALGKTLDDRSLEGRGYLKNISLITSSYATLPLHVVNTRRIATLPRSLAEISVKQHKIRMFPVPIEVPRIKEVVQWHASVGDDPALKWACISMCHVQFGMFQEDKYRSFPFPREVMEYANQEIRWPNKTENERPELDLAEE